MREEKLAFVVQGKMEFFPSKKAWGVWWLLPWPILLKKRERAARRPWAFSGQHPAW
jgi:hypothetical protein